MINRSTSRIAVLLTAALLCAACSDDPGTTPDAGTDAAPDATTTDAGPDPTDAADATDPPDAAAAELAAIVPGSIYAFPGDQVTLDGSASTGAVEYLWSFGDGTGWDTPRPDAVATATYDEIGRFHAVLTAYGPDGARRTASLLVTITPRPTHTPTASSTITVIPGRRRVAVVSPDSDEITIVRFRDGEFELLRRLGTDARPRTITTFDDWLIVACQDANTVLFHRQDDSESRRVFLPRGAQPFGVIAVEEAVFVTDAATGKIYRIEMPGGVPQVTASAHVVDDARHLSLLPDGRIAVSAWRSASTGARIAVVDRQLENVEIWPLEVDPTPASDTAMGGVPNYLGPLAVSPAGDTAVLPFMQANFIQGLARNGEPLDQDKAVRAVLSFVDPATGREDYSDRKHYDDRGHAAFALHTRFGDYTWVSMPSNRLIERYDNYGEVESGTVIDVGYSPQGIALSPNDRFLFVDAYLSRDLAVYDVSDLGGGLLQPVARIPIQSSEPLDPEVLSGKQLFNDAQDQRITAAGYLSCSNCHMEGLDDRRTWDFTGRGEGIRNTIALVGRGGTANGPLHWSANFDEIQDFEGDIRRHFGGTGLMTDEAWSAGSASDPLGDPKAGVSPELDALAAYVTSLDEHPESPHLVAGQLSPEAAAGKTIFESAITGCTDCHSGANFTDSSFVAPGVPLLHDVGTLTSLSGFRLGTDLDGIDTPTLRGIWHSAPYLHDGSAQTIREVLTSRNPADQHGVTSPLTSTELDQLEAYLLSL